MTEESVMKRLTAEELAHLEEYLIAPDADDSSTHCRYVSNRDMRALLAMASRLVEVESALEFLSSGPWELRHISEGRELLEIDSGAVLRLAKQEGWTSPTQKPNDGGRDG